MEEKKLTNEEVIKALDICYTSPCCTNECPYFNKNGRNFCAEKALYKDMKRIVQEHAEQKAEIERLTEENKELEKTVNDMSWVIKVHKYCVGANHCQNRSDGEFELQKQVDELKGKICELVADKCNLVIKEKQAVKDTAKEILDELDLFFKGTTFRKGYEFKKINEKLKEIAQRRGVEVE